MKKLKTVFATLLLLICMSAFATQPERPKLVVLLVIDQFRADTLMRFHDRFLPPHLKNGSLGGFRFLTEEGAYFPFAEYQHLQCMTGPGHSTLMTGALPYSSGIPTNYWYNQDSKDREYCVEDTRYHFVAGEKTPLHAGTSPENLKASTVGDELKNSGYPGRVVSLAIKDRAAILMGGHRPDTVIWHDFDSFHWVSSDYYQKDGKLPAWVVEENKKLDEMKGKNFEWKAGLKETGYSHAEHYGFGKDPLFGIGAAFPHQVPYNSKAALRSPIGVKMTFDLAKSALHSMKLGNGKWTDLLLMSISSHDYLAHSHGHNSRELEEMTIEEDLLISNFLNEIAKSVPGGIRSVDVILTADHGGDHVSEWLQKDRVNAGRIDEKKLLQDTNHFLEEKLGKLNGDAPYVVFGLDFQQYLNRSEIEKKGLSRFEVQQKAKEYLLQQPWVNTVVTEKDWNDRKIPAGIMGDQLQKTFYAKRSGDLYIWPLPHFIPAEDTASHLTGYSYDRMVPLIFYGKAFKAGRYSQKAYMTDLAPTLSHVLGLTPPNMSEGRVLGEAIH